MLAAHVIVEKLKQRGKAGGGILNNKNLHLAALTERPTADSAAESRSKLAIKLCFVRLGTRTSSA